MHFSGWMPRASGWNICNFSTLVGVKAGGLGKRASSKEKCRFATFGGRSTVGCQTGEPSPPSRLVDNHSNGGSQMSVRLRKEKPRVQKCFEHDDSDKIAMIYSSDVR